QAVLQHRDSICPLTRLPPEIVSEIFTFTLPDVGATELKATPWHLGQICRYCGNVALGLPILW
ncbi:hypothetical protein DFH09DRAFT_891679, partial [Mycena vulgaris]